MRIYGCPCGARLYTHEERDLTQVPLGVQVGLARRETEEPCPHCGSRTYYVSTHETEPPTLRRYLYTCACCYATHTTAELAAGQTDGPTPASRRGHQPHPYI